ncbi:hypothetical protein T01_7670 [Trichinella spiralis]|uniref:Uncharacterized protein n=1 Tax=Trichinella spiralis TaxID=6334 RepID=A0A0V1BRC5_TRISP|nr:hypothetical protein T01_7670 [Trichinella spiralis]
MWMKDVFFLNELIRNVVCQQVLRFYQSTWSYCYFFDVESTLADLSHACLYETAFKRLVVNVCVCADSIQLLLQNGERDGKCRKWASRNTIPASVQELLLNSLDHFVQTSIDDCATDQHVIQLS